MKSLLNLTRLLSKKEILTEEEAKDVIGGRRFQTNSHKRAMRKMERLRSKGHNPTMRDYGDHYCIEW